MVYLATPASEFGKGHDGLSAFVRDMFGTRSVQQPHLRVQVETGEDHQDPGLGSDRAGAGAQAARGRHVVRPGVRNSVVRLLRPHSSRRCSKGSIGGLFDPSARAVEELGGIGATN